MRRRIQSESDGEEEIEDVEEIEVEDLEEIEEDVEVPKANNRRSSQRSTRAVAEKPTSTRSTRASVARSTRASTVRSTRASSAAGPSSAPIQAQKGPVTVEIPYMPFANLKRYTYASGLKAPTTVTRSRTNAAQDGTGPALDAFPVFESKGKGRATRSSARTSTRNTPGGFGGYGDESEEQSTGPSETDYDSEDSLLTRRLRPRVFEPRRTRAQRKEFGTPPSEQPRYTRGQAAASQQAHWQTEDQSPAGSEYVESEGESEIDDMDELESDLDSHSAHSDDGGDVLRRHRPFCERCRAGPADELLAKALKSKKRGRKRKLDIIDEPIDPVEVAQSLEGWIECERCCVSSHWKCLTPAQQRKVLAEIAARNPEESGRRSIGIDESATFTCSRCEAFPVCFVCEKSRIKQSRPGTERPTEGDGAQTQPAENGGDGAQGQPIIVDDDDEEGGLIKSAPAPLLFRCDRCKQAVHYEHHKKFTTSELATFYQKPDEFNMFAWNGHCCREWKWLVDRVIAWRPLPADAEEPHREEGELPNYRDRLPREYLVKWKDRGFRHLSWVPHAWLLSINGAKLRHFIQKGPQLDLVTNETLAVKGDEMSAPTIQDVMADEARQRHPREVDAMEEKWRGHGPPPDPDAEASIPIDWSTADRILEVHLLPPKNRRKRKRIEDSDEEEDDPKKSLTDGMAPPTTLAVPIRDWEIRAERQLTADDVDEVASQVTWALIKWQNLQYDEACYDTPPARDSPLYPAYRTALKRYLAGRQVTIPILSKAASERRDEEAAKMKDPPEGQPDCVKGGKLMPFQIEGLQWLIYKYFQRQSCILADDMGLGKTIQVASFLGYLHSMDIYPSLVIVPNSTITNWVREIEKWVPDVRVVPYYGEALARKLISTHELYHPGKHMRPDGFKAHVILTTYETFINHHAMFKAFPRWECVIVDEGQRMKSDSSLIFSRLKQLHSVFRVLLTGTPLNNNLRELFNLLNFLDPGKFRDLRELEERFEKLNETLLSELHELISPYILRRIKREVLKLPPKVEIIVPIAMTTVQKQVTREILHRNVDTIENIVNKKRKLKAKGKAAAVEIVDITDDSPAANGNSREAASASAGAGPSGTTAEAGPADESAAEGDVPEPSDAAPAAAREPATEAMDVDEPNGNAILVEDSQPVSPPANNADQTSDDTCARQNNGEYDRKKAKMGRRGGFSVEGAAVAAARARWDRVRREKEGLEGRRMVADEASSLAVSHCEDPNADFDPPDSDEAEGDSVVPKHRKGGGGFSVAGAAAAAANARWAKARRERAEGSVVATTIMASIVPEDAVKEKPKRPRTRVKVAPPARTHAPPHRRGGFSVEGAAAAAANARWARARQERAMRATEAEAAAGSPHTSPEPALSSSHADDTGDEPSQATPAPAESPARANGSDNSLNNEAAEASHEAAQPDGSRTNGTPVEAPSQNGTQDLLHSQSQNGSASPNRERNGSAAAEASRDVLRASSQGSQSNPRSSQKQQKGRKFKLQL